MENEELRAYFFQNMYLQGIHAGIQSQHCTAEMFIKYRDYSDEDNTKDINHDRCIDMLHDWANHHKTTIVLNGGYAENLYRLVGLFSAPNNHYPWAYFCESEEALGGVITNVGIILPEKVFGLPKRLATIREANSKGLSYYPEEQCYNNMSEFDKQLVEEVMKCRLMN